MLCVRVTQAFLLLAANICVLVWAAIMLANPTDSCVTQAFHLVRFDTCGTGTFYRVREELSPFVSGTRDEAILWVDQGPNPPRMMLREAGCSRTRCFPAHYELTARCSDPSDFCCDQNCEHVGPRAFCNTALREFALYDRDFDPHPADPNDCASATHTWAVATADSFSPSDGLFGLFAAYSSWYIPAFWTCSGACPVSLVS